jgi:lysophospholipase L1-like esterase
MYRFTALRWSVRVYGVQKGLPMQTGTEKSPPGHEAEVLARCAFALLFTAALITLAVGLSSFSNRRILELCVVGFGVALAAMAFLLIAPPPLVQDAMRRITGLFAHSWLTLALSALVVAAIVLEIEIVSVLWPNAYRHVLILTLAWGTVLIAVMAISSARTLTRLYARTRRLWAGLGIAVTVGVICLVILVGGDALLHITGVSDGALAITTYREMIFYGNEVHPDWARQYWDELTRIKLGWVSYTYVWRQPFQGRFINIGSDGLRVTSAFVKDGEAAPSVHFFGGSTVWGTGSRDDYTLPSQVARLMNEAGTPIRAENYGQPGYVSTQDMILFQRQLALGNIPNVAVFYQGFNDLMAVRQDGNIAGLPQNEINRQRDLLAGQILRDAGHPLLSEPDADFSDLDFSLVGIADASPTQTAQLYLENLRQIRAVAQAYGVRTVFVWQPAFLLKKMRTARETEIYRNFYQQTFPELDSFSLSVEQEVRRAQNPGFSDLLLLSDLFADDPAQRFVDSVHVTEDANTVIARAIAAALLPLLKS